MSAIYQKNFNENQKGGSFWRNWLVVTIIEKRIPFEGEETQTLVAPGSSKKEDIDNNSENT